jgi:hypothetical protein
MEPISGAVAGGIVAVVFAAFKFGEKVIENKKHNDGNGSNGVIKDDVKSTRDMLQDAIVQTRLEHQAITNGIVALGKDTKEQTGEIKDMATELRNFTALMRANIPR